MEETKYKSTENKYITINQYNNELRRLNRTLNQKQDQMDQALNSKTKNVVASINEIKLDYDKQINEIQNLEKELKTCIDNKKILTEKIKELEEKKQD